MKKISSNSDSYRSFYKKTKNSLITKTKVETRNINYASYLKKPLLQKTVLFESAGGFSMEGDPRSIFERMRKDERFRGYHYVWMIRSRALVKCIERFFDKEDNISFVVFNGDEYFRTLATAKYLVTDNRFPGWFIRRKDQVYLNTDCWFDNEKLGYNVDEYYLDQTRMKVKDYLSATHLLSSGSYHTEYVLKKDYKLASIFHGIVLEGIAPRLLDMRDMEQKVAKERFAAVGMEPEKKQLLFAFGKPGMIKDKLDLVRETALKANKDWQVCLKIHPREYTDALEAFADTNILLIKNFANMTECLSAADMVVGDGFQYTYDYLVTNRPILLCNMTGRAADEVLQKTELPGPEIHNASEILQAMDNPDAVLTQYKAQYEACKSRLGMHGREDMWSQGIRQIFANEEIDADQIVSLKDDKIPVVLIAPLAEGDKEGCSFWSKFFTNFLDWIDYDKYDVTVVTNKPKTYAGGIWIEKNLNSHARIIYRAGMMIQTEKKYIDFKYLVYTWFYADDVEKALSYMDQEDCDNDWLRTFGYAKFDTAVYFGPPIANLLLLTHGLDVKHKYIVDQRNYSLLIPPIFPSERMEKRFENIFKIYETFDKVFHYNQEIIDFLKDNNGIYHESKHEVLESFLMKRILDMKEEELPLGQYKDQDYYLTDKIYYADGQLQVNMFQKLDETKKNYATMVELCADTDINRLISGFAKMKKQNDQVCFYIFDPYSQWESMLDGPIQANELAENVVVCNNHFLCNMMKYFDGYVSCYDTKDKDRYYYACSYLGVPYRTYVEDDFSSDTFTKEQYEARIRAYIESILH